MSDTGTTSAITHYDPYGLARPGSSLGSGIGYAGEWRDGTGLVNLRARAYDPTLARFIGRDTYGGVLSAPQSANRYSYAQNNPYRYTDPSGHFVQTVVEDPGEVASLLVQLTPPGIAYSVLTVVTGWDVLAGRALSDDERSLGLLLIVGGSAALVIAQVAGAAFRALARAGAKLSGGIDRLDRAFGSLTSRLRGAGEGLGAKVRGGASLARQDARTLYYSDGRALPRIAGGSGSLGEAAGTVAERFGLTASEASSFATLRPRTFEPGQIFYRSEATSSRGPGRFLGTRGFTTREGAEQLYFLRAWNNPTEVVRTYRLTEATVLPYGRVAGGSGYQAFVPRSIDPDKILELVSEAALR